MVCPTSYSFHPSYPLLSCHSPYPILQGLRKYAFESSSLSCHSPLYFSPSSLILASKFSLQRLRPDLSLSPTPTNVAHYRAQTSPRRSASPTSSTFSSTSFHVTSPSSLACLALEKMLPKRRSRARLARREILCVGIDIQFSHFHS